MIYEEGFYTLTRPSEPEPVLVHGYPCTGMGGEFVFGFNIFDGGYLVVASDLPDDTVVQRINIVPYGCPFKLEVN